MPTRGDIMRLLLQAQQERRTARLNEEVEEVSELLNCIRRRLKRKREIEESLTNIRRMSAQSYLMPVVLLAESGEEDTSTR